MNHLWLKTININEDMAKLLIESQTTIHVHNIETFGEGFDNVAYLINKEFIFRFPRREAGIECIEFARILL